MIVILNVTFSLTLNFFELLDVIINVFVDHIQSF